MKREPNDELLEDIKEERISEVTELPPSKNVDISRIPSPLPFQKNRNSIVDLDNVISFTFFFLHKVKKYREIGNGSKILYCVGNSVH